jgi:hypothetical protein
MCLYYSTLQLIKLITKIIIIFLIYEVPSSNIYLLLRAHDIINQHSQQAAQHNFKKLKHETVTEQNIMKF